MRHLFATGFAVLAFSPTLWALDEPPDKPKSPRARYEALFQEQQKAMEAFMQVYEKATTDAERNKLKYPQPDTYVPGFLEIADSAPDDPAALDCLVWIATRSRGGSSQFDKILSRLAEKHADSKKVGDVAMRLVYVQSPAADTLLKAILDKNPDRKAKGLACLAMAQRQLNKKEESKAEPLYEKAEKEFGDIDVGRGTIGKLAKAALHEIRALGIGKPAPEIKGEDIDGKAFALSDYKGKVVVIDFWGDW